MTIEERNTAKAIQDIAREFRKPKRIDWEQRRYEIARDALTGLLSNPEINKLYDEGCSILMKSYKLGLGKQTAYAQYAINFADALIAELKKGGER